jgi:5-formyltetrahydrofolate cyclo-ligase
MGGSQRWAWWMKDRRRRWVCQPEVEATVAAEALEAWVAAGVVIDGHQRRLGRGGG